MSNYYNKTTEQTLKDLQSSEHGLSTEEVNNRLRQYGKNVVSIRGVPLWRKIVEPFANVFVGVLLFAAVLSIVTNHPVDAIIIGAIITISAIIYYGQQLSTDRVLKALKQHDSHEVSVIRDGIPVRISAEELVPGDRYVISEGEKVPADSRILHADNVRTDEAMLTGESLPINKHVHALQGEHPIYDRANMLFQGSFLVSGRATAIVTATGAHSEFGHLAELAAPTSERSPVQKKIDQLITKLIIAIAIVCSVVFALALFRGIEIAEALRFVLALAVSAVPEGLPVAITVILVLGMRRLAQYKSLARSMKAIEAIGIVTTIASDKTGTLTKNQLSVQETWQLQEKDTSPITRWIALAANNAQGGIADPLDTALIDYAKNESANIDDESIVKSFPFDQALAMSGNVWQRGKEFHLVLKGSPEHVIKKSLSGTPKSLELAEKTLHHYTGLGYRVIAIAEIQQLKSAPESLELTKNASMKFVGLIAIADELRPEAAEAIRTARTAGITVRMITGDHAETAFSIGKKLGLVEQRDQVLDCRTIDTLSDEELVKKVESVRVFARVIPEAKHRILSVLKTNNIAAMTGDGVNDVPALTNAHVGVAMGSGSQIAKDASDIVLLDDNFASIIKAVKGGRVINDNIRRILFYVLATSLGEVLVMIGSLVIGLPLPVVAVQILWINLVTDTVFAIPLGVEKAEDDVMHRQPRRYNQPILDGVLLQRFIIIAVAMSSTALVIFWYFLQNNTVEYARTIAFTSLVVMQWANAVNARSEFASLTRRIRVPNRAFAIGFVIAIIAQLTALFGPLAGPLYVVPVDILSLALAAAASFSIIVLVGELHKAYSRATRDKLHQVN